VIEVLKALDAIWKLQESYPALRPLFHFVGSFVYYFLSALPILAIAGVVAACIWLYLRLEDATRWVAKRLRKPGSSGDSPPAT
jgi:hypothetical protein